MVIVSDRWMDRSIMNGWVGGWINVETVSQKLRKEGDERDPLEEEEQARTGRGGLSSSSGN